MQDIPASHCGPGYFGLQRSPNPLAIVTVAFTLRPLSQFRAISITFPQPILLGSTTEYLPVSLFVILPLFSVYKVVTAKVA